METKFNFKSSVCTSREQSERLLALGLKKETADMFYAAVHNGTKVVGYRISPDYNDEHFEIFTDDIPAWSLGRLIEMLPSPIPISENLPTFNHYAYLNLSNESIGYYWEDYDGAGRALIGFTGNGFFAAVVDAIEWLIKEGNFPKEYLEE